MKRKGNESENKVDPIKKKRKLDENKVDSIQKKGEVDDNYEDEHDNKGIIIHKAIPELNLSSVVSPTITINQMCQNLIYYQNFFKIVPMQDEVDCFGCGYEIKIPPNWKNKSYDRGLIKDALCKFCKFGNELSKRCKVLEDEYFKRNSI